MDYESRKVKWYWMFLFIIYCGVAVYLLFQGNPYLYAKAELHAALDVGETTRHQTIPLHPVAVAASASTFQTRYSFERTGIDPLGSPRSKNFQEFEHFNVDFGIDKFEPQNVASDASGFYLSGKNLWVIAVGLDGKVRWRYKFRDALTDSHSILPVLIDQNSAYLVHPSGQVACLDKQSGELRWVLSLKTDVVSNPFLFKGNLVVPTKAQTGVEMTTINRSTGVLNEDSPHLEIKPGFQLSESPSLDVLIATVDNKVIAVEPEDWQVQWSQTLTDPVKGPAVTVGSQIYVATLGAKLIKLDGSRKGKVDWEADLTKPPAGGPAFIPVVNRLTVLDTSGSISVIDAKSGKVYMRFSTENHNPLAETWSARLKGQHIEEFKMDWLQKGWTVWSPCFDSAFCIYTPNKAMLVNRLAMSGRPVALPLPVERRLVFLNQNKAGHFVISNMMEESEIKKLRKEQSTGTNP